jgi:hypothetical protein
MAIEAFYPSRRQSRRHNPLFRRERRARRMGVALTLSFCLFGFYALRLGPSDAAAEGTTIVKAERILPASSGVPMLEVRQISRKPVRVIPLYKIPEDAALAASQRG